MQTPTKRFTSSKTVCLFRNCSILFAPRQRKSDNLTLFDEAIRSTRQTVLNVHLDEQTRQQLTLSVKCAGMGIHNVTELSTPAFLSSVSKSRALVESIIKQDCQKLMYEKQLKNGGYLWEKMKLHRTATIRRNRKSGINLLLKFVSRSSKTSSLRLGANILSPYTCVCGAQADVKGIHALSCAKSSSCHTRHSLGNEAIKRAFCLTDIQSSVEPVGLSRDDGKRPDGITLSPWKNGLCLIWDFTCVDRLAMSNVARGTFPGLTIADNAEEAKQMKYESLTRNYIFQLVAGISSRS